MATNLGYVLIIGLAAYKSTEFYKEITRRLGLSYQPGWWKSLICLASCALLTLLIFHRSASTRVLIGLAAAGLAALVHATDTLLRTRRDEGVSQVMSQGRQRRQRP